MVMKRGRDASATVSRLSSLVWLLEQTESRLGVSAEDAHGDAHVPEGTMKIICFLHFYYLSEMPRPEPSETNKSLEGGCLENAF